MFEATTRIARRSIGTSALTLLVALVLLISVGRGDSVSDLRRFAGPYQQDIVLWEITHFPDKWVRLATTWLFRRSPNDEERNNAVREFFALGDDLASERSSLARNLAVAPEARDQTPEEAQAAIDELEERRASVQQTVEEALESTISRTVDDMGIISHVGPVRWPPVDFTFQPSGLLLVRSPRDEIVRLDDILLDPGLSALDRVALEDEAEREENIAALVVRIGGVATYPAQVTPEASLHGTLALASHEWLHHWLFFRPLGRGWFEGGELTSINETVANIFGEEVGDLALTSLTGEVIEREPWKPPTLQPPAGAPPDQFDFARAMRKTRVQLEALLTEGMVDETEAFLEERRQEFVANGVFIRKLNNAWFAFNGTYADNPASISPIEGQLRAIRADSSGLGAFLDSVASITKQGQLEEMARAAGWEPTPFR